MSFYDDASLVVIPSAQKTSKLYAVKPTDGSGDLAFTRTGDTATRVNSAGLIVPVLANVPRLDYLGSTCGKLLLEPQRTNLVTYSEQLDNAAWTKDGATVTANTAVSPDGYTNADKVLETATTAVHNVYQTPTLSSNVYSFSVFVKKAERFKCALADRNTGAYVAFNTNTGVIIESLVFSGKIESYSNDWYRLTITTPSAYSVFVPQVFILPDNYTTGVPALITYAGSATSGLFVWGCQLEQGAYSTSLIPTIAASATRGADACSKTGISSLIGQTEGTLFFDIQKLYLTGDRSIAILYGGSGASYIQVFLINDIRVIINGTLITNGVTLAENTRYKIAVAYKNGSHALYVNGAQIATSASSVAPTVLNDYYLGNAFATEQSGIYNQALLFKTRLTNAELATLTTL